MSGIYDVWNGLSGTLAVLLPPLGPFNEGPATFRLVPMPLALTPPTASTGASIFGIYEVWNALSGTLAVLLPPPLGPFIEGPAGFKLKVGPLLLSPHPPNVSSGASVFGIYEVWKRLSGTIMLLLGAFPLLGAFGPAGLSMSDGPLRASLPTASSGASVLGIYDV